MILKRRRCECDHEIEKVEENLPPAKKATVTKLKMVVASTYYPKPDRRHPRGQDAHFISDRHQTVGLADGVGGWVRHGVDAGHYARVLMLNASFSVLHQPVGSVDPRTVLNEAFLSTTVQGSSTACIATLKNDADNNPNHNNDNIRHVLHAVNVGDSGFMVFRKNRLWFRSPVQQHRFNRPYQLGNSEKSDKPETATEMEVVVAAGDVVVFGTDGVFDNVYATEIESYVGLAVDGDPVDPHELAWMIAEAALCNSRNRCTRTPFEEAARKAGKDHVGGKVDDITVLVAHILPC